jgi:hypothetical protein
MLLTTVLAQFLEKLIVFHNTEYQTTLKLADFDSYHFCNVWGGTNEEGMLLCWLFADSNLFWALF